MNGNRVSFGPYGSYYEISFLDRQFGLLVSVMSSEMIDKRFQSRDQMRM